MLALPLFCLFFTRNTTFLQKNEKLVLATFDKKNFLYLQKDEPTSVRSMTKEEIPDSNKYNLQGMKVEDPEGIYIQNGQKFIAK